MTMSSLIAWTRYSLIVKDQKAANWAIVTMLCPAAMWLPFIEQFYYWLANICIIYGIYCLFLWFDDFDDIEVSYFEQKLLVIDTCGNIQAICLKAFGKSDVGWLYWSSGMMRNIQSLAMFWYCYAICVVLVSKMCSYLQAKRNWKFPHTMGYLWLHWATELSCVGWTRLQYRCLDWSITRLRYTPFAKLVIFMEGGGMIELLACWHTTWPYSLAQQSFKQSMYFQANFCQENNKYITIEPVFIWLSNWPSRNSWKVCALTSPCSQVQYQLKVPILAMWSCLEICSILQCWWTVQDFHERSALAPWRKSLADCCWEHLPSMGQWQL